MSRGDRDIPRDELREAAREAAADVRAIAREAAAEVKAAAAAYARELAEERLADVVESRRSRLPGREADTSIWARPQPGARRARLTREEIAQAALAIADAEGLDAVSMRRVAADLGVGTMSLYHYVRTKAELLELMSDAMVAEVLVPPAELPEEWRPALRTIGLRTVAVFRRHPWAVEAPPSTPGPNAMRHFDQSLQAVAGLAVDLQTRLEMIAMIDDYAFGFVLSQARDAREREAREAGSLDSLAAYVEAQIGTGEYPYLEEIAAGATSTRAAIEELEERMNDEERFARGLDRLLDGIALDLERRGLEPGRGRGRRTPRPRA